MTVLFHVDLEQLSTISRVTKQQAAFFLFFISFLLLFTYQNSFSSDYTQYSLQIHTPSQEIPKDIILDGTLWSRQRFPLEPSFYNQTQKELLSNHTIFNREKYNNNYDNFLQEQDDDDDRVEKQREWIKSVANSEQFLGILKRKRVLVLDGFHTVYKSNGNLDCPPDSKNFDSACEFLEEKWYTKFGHVNLFNFDAVVTIRNWEYRLFEGKLPDSIQQVMVAFENSFVTRGSADFGVNDAIFVSYWRGSDVVVPWAKWVKNSTPVKIIPSPAKNYAEGKTKLAAIVVSDCEPEPPGSFNQRLKYVRQLQRYIKVDIYGRCGNLSCGSDCFDLLGKNYKFYLAFENANCRDYITEKFFRNALMHNMIPVALGSLKRDYEFVAPPDSFIHVEDFASPWDLASYLKTVDEDDVLYNKYFKWKSQQGDFILDPAQDIFCRICAMLHYKDFIPPKPWPPAESTWKKLNKCLPLRHWYWNRPNQ